MINLETSMQPRVSRRVYLQIQSLGLQTTIGALYLRERLILPKCTIHEGAERNHDESRGGHKTICRYK